MDNIRLACAACRILIYRLCNRIRGHQPPAPKKEKQVVCIGLSGSGKSTALALIAGEPIKEIQSTNGFHVKDVILSDCILNVKEIGGSEKIRKYWRHYYGGAQGVIFMVDGTTNEQELETARVAMFDALKDPQLCDLPILLLVTHQDMENARSASEVAELWNVREFYEDSVMEYGSSIKNIEQLKEAFSAFASILLHGVVGPTNVNVDI